MTVYICFSIDCSLTLYHTPWSDFRRLIKIKIRLSPIIPFPLKYDNKNCTIIQQLSLAPQQLITSTYTYYLHDLFMTFSAVLHREYNIIT